MSIFLYGCKEDPIYPKIVDLNIDIQFIDTLGRDLLDQSKLYSYKFSEMKHYYIDSQNNTTRVNYYTNGSIPDYPEGMLIHSIDTTFTLRVFPFIYSFNKGLLTFTDIIQLNSIDSDTIISEIELKPNSSIVKKVWYNNRLVFDYDTNSTGRFFVISK